MYLSVINTALLRKKLCQFPLIRAAVNQTALLHPACVNISFHYVMVNKHRATLCLHKT